MKRAWLALAACIALALTSGGVASATVAAGTGRAVTAAEQLPDGDGPPGFWWAPTACRLPCRTACLTSAAPTAGTSG